MAKKTVADIDVSGKKVLLRVDFNVPLDMNTGALSDDSRIRACLPTIRYLIEHKAKVIICSHLGRPNGKVVEQLRMKPVAKRLSELLGLPVSVVNDCVGTEVEQKVNSLRAGEILLLENLRFHPEEEANDPAFAKELAKLADVYVNDAFGTAHRAHASTVGVTKFLPAVAGFLMAKELEVLGNILRDPERPFACLVGGAKVSDKIGLLQNMLKKVDKLLIGGGMASTFLRAQGYEVGRSAIELDKLSLAEKLLREAREWKVPLLLPIDVVVAANIKAEEQPHVVPVDNVPSDKYIVDIGPKTIEVFCDELKGCRTIMWNGPLGVYEIPQFAQGTKSVVQFLSTLDATVVVGGGSSAEVVEDLALTEKMSHVSTGGGASLRFLEGLPLPGVEALLDKDKQE
jgi:phosphoglycerate kinase